MGSQSCKFLLFFFFLWFRSFPSVRFGLIFVFGKYLQSGDFFTQDGGMPKTPFPNGWKGGDGLYTVGFTRRGLLGTASDAVHIARDIAEQWRTFNATNNICNTHVILRRKPQQKSLLKRKKKKKKKENQKLGWVSLGWQGLYGVFHSSPSRRISTFSFFTLL